MGSSGLLDLELLGPHKIGGGGADKSDLSFRCTPEFKACRSLFCPRLVPFLSLFILHLNFPLVRKKSSQAESIPLKRRT